MLGNIEGKRRRVRQRMRWSNGVTNSMDTSFSKFWEIAKDREDWHRAVHGVAKNQRGHSNRTTTITIYIYIHHVALVVKNPPDNVAGDVRYAV